MICLLAGNYLEAQRFATAHDLDDNEWFMPADIAELYGRNNFHVLVIGTAGHNVPNSYFERVYQLAKQRGRIGR